MNSVHLFLFAFSNALPILKGETKKEKDRHRLTAALIHLTVVHIRLKMLLYQEYLLISVCTI